MMKTFELEEIFPDEAAAAKKAKEDIVETAKKTFTVKGIARLVVGSSVKFVVTSTIASLVPVESRKDKVKVLVGGYVISGVIAEHAKRYISDDIDEKFEFCRDVYDKAKELVAAQKADAICPICKGPANKQGDQEGTIYCADSNCNFMGVVPIP